MSLSYKSNKGIRLTLLSKQYFVPPLAKKWGSNFFFPRSAHKIVPLFQNRGAAQVFETVPRMIQPICADVFFPQRCLRDAAFTLDVMWCSSRRRVPRTAAISRRGGRRARAARLSTASRRAGAARPLAEGRRPAEAGRRPRRRLGRRQSEDPRRRQGRLRTVRLRRVQHRRRETELPRSAHRQRYSVFLLSPT